MGAGSVDVFDEELGVEPFPHQPSVVVGEGHEHGVDGAGAHVLGQFVEGQHPGGIDHGRAVGHGYVSNWN
ncbi:MAG: hypothetical protein R3A10_07130 [Caldilineaceae bacterium]